MDWQKLAANTGSRILLTTLHVFVCVCVCVCVCVLKRVRVVVIEVVVTLRSNAHGVISIYVFESVYANAALKVPQLVNELTKSPVS
jgi:hypothetical protein